MTITLSIASPKHIPAIVDLARQYWEYEQLKPFKPAAIQALVEKIVVEPSFGVCWVAHQQEQLQGYLVCSCVPSFEDGGPIALIADLYVAAEARRNGVGQQLVSAAEQVMRQRGCVQIAMEVAQKNIRAQQFYSILGFATRAGYSTMHKAL